MAFRFFNRLHGRTLNSRHIFQRTTNSSNTFSAILQRTQRNFSSARKLDPKLQFTKEQLLRQKMQAESSKNTRNILVGIGVLSLGLAYASVPLYTMFCQVTGYGGTTQRDERLEKLTKLKQRHLEDPDSIKKRKITVKFTSGCDTRLPWKFEPQQKSITLDVGETSLAFFKATNTIDEPLVGVATYNVIPLRAGLYFNKVQCFCFDEQRLRGGEEVDMPVLFYLDPEMLDDPRLDGVDTVTLAYQFFLSDADPGTDEDGSEVLPYNHPENIAENLANSDNEQA